MINTTNLSPSNYSLEHDMFLKTFMDEMWVADEVDGKKVVDRQLGYGSLPDIKLFLEGGEIVSAKEMWVEKYYRIYPHYIED